MSFIAVGVGVGVVANIAGGIFGSSKAKKRQRAAAAEKRKLGIELNNLENSRQSIINPFATTRDVSALASNTFANLGVATKAAEFQAEQVDISLANTLDTMRATGAGAGGATALAQAALQSKQGISASLEQQETVNEKLRAQGAADLDRIQIAEAGRVQASQAQGAMFQFQAREEREQSKIDRVAGQMGLAANAERQAQADRSAAWSNAISGIGTAVAGGVQAYGSVAAAKAMPR